MLRFSNSLLLVLALAFASAAADTPPVAASGIAVLRNGFTLQFDHREIRDNVTRLYLAAGSDSYVDVATDQISNFQAVPTQVVLPAPAPPPKPSLDDIVNSAGDKHALDADFIRSVIRAESDFKPTAVSRKGARGLMQLMPGTATRLGVADSFDPAANVDAGVRYLRELLTRYHGDVAKALAAYNAGTQRVEQYNGVPPYPETRAYVARIIRDYNRKKLADRAQSAAKAANSAASTP